MMQRKDKQGRRKNVETDEVSVYLLKRKKKDARISYTLSSITSVTSNTFIMGLVLAPEAWPAYYSVAN